jgi:DNA repair exonuclease SbcCD ATPase subunit
VRAACPVCGRPLQPEDELEVEKETYVGTESLPGEMIIYLPFCNVGAICNRVLAANKLDELAEPFLEAVGNA